MSGEAVVVGGILAAIATAMIGVLGYQRALEASLARRDTITLRVAPVGRTVLVVVVALILPPVAVGALATVTDPWARTHAEITVLTAVFGGLGTLPIALWANARARPTLALTLTPTTLTLARAGEEPRVVRLDRPFELRLWATTGAEGVPWQGVEVVQGATSVAFVFSLGVNGVAEGRAGGLVAAAFGREAGIVLARLRARAGVAG